MNCRSFRCVGRWRFQTMGFSIERSFLKLVADSENEFRLSLILRFCISEQLQHNLFQMNTICMARSSTFLRKWDLFARRGNVDLQNKTNYFAVQWRVLKGYEWTINRKLWKSDPFFRFYNYMEWLPLRRNTSPITWNVWRLLVRVMVKSYWWWRRLYWWWRRLYGRRGFLMVFLKASSNLSVV